MKRQCYYRPKKKNREHNNPEYKQWRQGVKDRDAYKCQWPGCGSQHRLEVHHIKTWSKYPGLRFATANGITLCQKCHKSIKGKEQYFEAFFLKLLEYQMLDKIKKWSK